MGFNAESGAYEDLMEAGVIDPTKVTDTPFRTPPRWRLCYHHRSHDCRETQERIPDAAMPGGGMGGMEGMY